MKIKSILKVLQGNSLPFLAAMASVGDWKGSPLWRPWLQIPKSELVAYCQRNLLPVWEDKTNEDPQFLRTRMRQSIVPVLETSFGKKPIPVRSGGSIPIISTFEKVLGIKSILLGFGLDADAIHSPNESYPLFNFYKGIETIPLFYKYYREMK